MISLPFCSSFFFFNDTATTEIYTLFLHDALPISPTDAGVVAMPFADYAVPLVREGIVYTGTYRSEEHTSELQSHLNLVCRLLLEKKKKQNNWLAGWRQTKSHAALLSLEVPGSIAV